MALKMEAEIDFRIIANPLGCSFYSCELILEEVLGSWLSSIGKIEKVFSFGGQHKLLQLHRQRFAEIEFPVLYVLSLPNNPFIKSQD